MAAGENASGKENLGRRRELQGAQEPKTELPE
jgi:hypothetical protein